MKSLIFAIALLLPCAVQAEEQVTGKIVAEFTASDGGKLVLMRVKVGPPAPVSPSEYVKKHKEYVDNQPQQNWNNFMYYFNSQVTKHDFSKSDTILIPVYSDLSEQELERALNLIRELGWEVDKSVLRGRLALRVRLPLSPRFLPE